MELADPGFFAPTRFRAPNQTNFEAEISTRGFASRGELRRLYLILAPLVVCIQGLSCYNAAPVIGINLIPKAINRLFALTRVRV